MATTVIVTVARGFGSKLVMNAWIIDQFVIVLVPTIAIVAPSSPIYKIFHPLHRYEWIRHADASSSTYHPHTIPYPTYYHM